MYTACSHGLDRPSRQLDPDFDFAKAVAESFEHGDDSGDENFDHGVGPSDGIAIFSSPVPLLEEASPSASELASVHPLRLGRKRKARQEDPDSGKYEEGEIPELGGSEAKAIKLTRKQVKRENYCKKRSAQRQAASQIPTFGAYKVRSSIREKHTGNAEGHQTTLESESIKVAKTGFVGVSGDWTSAPVPLSKLVGPGSKFGFELVEWDGRAALPLLDSVGRVVAVLAGRPPDDSWEIAHMEAADRLERARGECRFSGSTTGRRRGKFKWLTVGISHGTGQKEPANLKLDQNKDVALSLTQHPSFIRFSGFANAAFATWAPSLHRYYLENIRSLLKHERHQHLTLPFPKSVWAAATFNLGPSTECFKHKDSKNLPFGWCAITSLGSFDPRLGGHLVLWEARRVIEFPPGSVVLIPSAAISHSNTPIQKGERRYSFTQFTAGALFRWVYCGFQPVGDHKKELSEIEKAEEEKMLGKQLEEGLKKFYTLDEMKQVNTAQ